MIKLKDLLSCCRSNVYIMTGPVPALIISPSLDVNGIIDKLLLDTEVKSISVLNNNGIKMELKYNSKPKEKEKGRSKMSKSLCHSCRHNCTDHKTKSSINHNGIWCNANYGRVIKKKVKGCKDYEPRSGREK